MRILVIILLLFSSTAALGATGTAVSYTLHGEEFEGYFIASEANVPLVFLVHDRDGLTDNEIKRASMLAELGYAVFCVDMYGKNIRPTRNQEKKALIKELHADQLRMHALLNSALAAAKAQGGDFDHIVALGFSFAGTVVRELARMESEIDSFVVFHDGLAVPEEVDYPEARLQVLVRREFSGQDSVIKDLATMAMGGAGVMPEMIASVNVSHSSALWKVPEYRIGAEKIMGAFYCLFCCCIQEVTDGEKSRGRLQPLQIPVMSGKLSFSL